MNTDELIEVKDKKSVHSISYGKPEICSEKNKFLVWIFDCFFEFVTNKYFRSVRVKNKQNYDLRNPDYANIFYGSHSCYWDG